MVECDAGDIEFAVSGGGDQNITIPNTRSRATKCLHHRQNPDLVFKISPDSSSADPPICVLELSWNNESLTLLKQEVCMWAAGGGAAIGIKVAFKGQSGDTKAKEVFQVGDDHTTVTVEMLLKESRSAPMRRWTCGPGVRTRSVLPQSEGDAALLPLNIFTQDPDAGGRHALIHLPSIARLIFAYVKRMAEADAGQELRFDTSCHLKILQLETEMSSLARLARTDEVKRMITSREGRVATLEDKIRRFKQVKQGTDGSSMS